MRLATRTRWATVAAGVLFAGVAASGCSSDEASDAGASESSDVVSESSPSTTVAPPTSEPSAEPSTSGSSSTGVVTTLPSSLPPPEPTGVPGVDDSDPYCAAWARYTGSVQAVAIAAAFGEVEMADLARLEVVAAAALVTAAEGIGSAWPSELDAERDVVLDSLIGPFARRAQKAIAALRSAGATEADLAALAEVWLDALRSRDPGDPVVEVPPLSGELERLVDEAAGAFAAAVTPFPRDPSLTTVVAATPATDAYLAERCPALADQGIGDAV